MEDYRYIGLNVVNELAQAYRIIEALKRENKELETALNETGQLLQQLAEEKFGGNWDGEIVFSRMNGMTAAFIRYDLYQKVEKERDELKVQLLALKLGK